MKVIHKEGSRPIKMWTEDIEDKALQQLKNIATLPFIHHHGVAVMPDAHFGIGTTVGSVVATTTAIIPAAAGVDLGCGMCAARTTLTASDLPDSLRQLRHDIERGIPLGAGGAHKFSEERENKLLDGYGELVMRLEQVCRYTPIKDPFRKAFNQLGTLGSGNHFVELCLDESNQVWVMLHSGSRGLGNIIGRIYIEQAKEKMEEYFITLPDRDLAYLPDGSEEFKRYMYAVDWAQDYAMANRQVMMDVVLKALHHSVKPFEVTSEVVNCHHNYIAKENHFGQNLWVTRKGAIRAREGDLGIIPGSMGTKSYIVRGKGSTESYHSCSHGAGRTMSRTEALSRFTVDDLIRQTEGVECIKDSSVLDEIPGGYKDIDVVMENQRDLVDIVHTLKGVLCIKGPSEKRKT